MFCWAYPFGCHHRWGRVKWSGFKGQRIPHHVQFIYVGAILDFECPSAHFMIHEQISFSFLVFKPVKSLSLDCMHVIAWIWNLWSVCTSHCYYRYWLTLSALGFVQFCLDSFIIYHFVSYSCGNNIVLLGFPSMSFHLHTVHPDKNLWRQPVWKHGSSHSTVSCIWHYQWITWTLALNLVRTSPGPLCRCVVYNWFAVSKIACICHHDTQVRDDSINYFQVSSKAGWEVISIQSLWVIRPEVAILAGKILWLFFIHGKAIVTHGRLFISSESIKKRGNITRNQ